MDYGSLGLDQYLIAKDSLANSERPNPYEADSQVSPAVGGISYYQTSIGREYRAIVAMNPLQGAFTDIQAAVNYVDSVGGGNILIEVGTFIPNNHIVIPSNIGLIGLSNNRSVIDFNNGTYSLTARGTFSNYKRNIIINNLNIINCANGSGALVFDYTKDSYITNCLFAGNGTNSGTTGCDVYVSDPRNFYLTNNFSTNSMRFLWGNDANADTQYFIVKNNVIETTTKEGMRFTSGYKISITNNTIKRPSSDGILITSGMADADIYGNTIDECFTYGVRLLSGEDKEANTISGNHIYALGTASTNTGISIGSAGFNNIISNNVIRGFDGDGIEISGVDDTTITGNNIYTNGEYGIDILNSGCDRSVIVGNSLHGNGTAIRDNGTNSVIANNGTL